MAFSVKDWKDRPPALNPNPDETLADWFTRIAAYVAAHPGAITPFNAAAIEDLETRLSDYTDAEIATLAAAIALLAPLDSPGFTGTPTAPTATDGDDSFKLATTAFVQAALAGLGGGGGGGVTPLSWTALSMGAGWSNGGGSGSYFDCEYAKDDYGVVHLRGVAYRATDWTSARLIGTLPASFRPPRYHVCSVPITANSNGNFVEFLWVAPNGQITQPSDITFDSTGSGANRTTGGLVFLDNVRIPTA